MLYRALLMLFLLLPFRGIAQDHANTSLQVFFTDSNGKFFNSTPEIQLLDMVTGKVIKKFYRTVDTADVPDPQTVPPGTYNLFTAGRRKELMRHVVIEVGKKNKVTIKISNDGTLRFRYVNDSDNPIGRLVFEYEALVALCTEKKSDTVRQNCWEEKQYLSGNYYIIVNTLPSTRYKVDIDFGAITEIRLSQPGFVHLIGDKSDTVISLYAPLGKKMVSFTEVKLTGSNSGHKVQLKPGTYEAHWKAEKNGLEMVRRFKVKSNCVTDLALQ